MVPQETGLRGLSPAQLQQILGTLDPNRAIEIECVYLAAFFDSRAK
ncbi:hypothetical protein ACFYZB_23660 [Streptomyces sp. NPDC001852]